MSKQQNINKYDFNNIYRDTDPSIPNSGGPNEQNKDKDGVYRTEGDDRIFMNTPMTDSEAYSGSKGETSGWESAEDGLQGETRQLVSSQVENSRMREQESTQICELIKAVSTMAIESRTFQSFDGKGSINDFVKQFDNMDNFMNDAQIIMMARKSMKGIVGLWFDSLDEEEVISWKDLKKKLLNRFTDNPRNSAKKFFKFLQQGPTEGILAYAYTLKKLGKGIQGSLEDTKEELENYMPVRLLIKLEFTESWDDVIRLLEKKGEECDTYLRERKLRQSYKNSKKKEFQKDANEKINTEAKYIEKKIIECYVCGGPHLASKCEMKFNKEDKKKNTRKNSEERTEQLNILEQGKNEIVLSIKEEQDEVTSLVYVEVDKNPQIGLIDTGASANFINEEIAYKLFADKIVNQKYDLSAANNSIAANSKVDVFLKIGNSELKTEFILIKNLVHPVIIGRSFLNKTGGEIKLRKKCVIINGEEIPLLHQRSIILFNEQIVPNEQTVWVETEVLDTGIVETIIPGVSTPGDYFLKKGKCKFLLSNNTARTIKLMKGMIIGRTVGVQRSEIVREEISFVKCESGDKRINLLIEKYLEAKNNVNNKRNEEIEPFRIDVLEGQENTKVMRRQYRLNDLKKEFIRTEVVRLLEKGVIEESLSEWNLPVVCAKKGDSYRLCIDFTRLNDITVKHLVPPPDIEEILDNLGKAKLFSVLDLRDGYFHIELDKSCRKMTAFTTDIGKFQYRKLPFGLCNAPAKFVAFITHVLRDFIPNKCIAYMDDIIVFSDNEVQHEDDLEKILIRMGEWNLELKPEKCQFFMREAQFCGYKIKDGQYKPDDKGLGKLSRHIEIKNVKELQSAHGFLNYYRKYVQNFSDKVREINRMISGKSKFDRDAAEEYVRFLREEIINSNPLRIPDMSEKFIIETDASNFGLGGVLKQKIKNEEILIKFASRSLRGAELNYSVTEKELLAIVWAVKFFDHYLFNPFTIRTDHKPLIWLKNIENPEGRLARWIMKLSKYQYDVEHIDGKKNNMADFLSREEICRMEIETREFSQNEKLKLAKDAHLACGHGGRDATYYFLKNIAHFNGMMKIVKQILSECQVCVKKRNEEKFKYVYNDESRIFYQVGVDITGPLPKTNSGKKFICVMTDQASGYAEVEAMKDKSSKSVFKVLLRKIFLRHGAPVLLRCDQGKEFISKIIQLLSEFWKTKIQYTAPYTPRANGKVERTNQSILLKLMKVTNEERTEWDKYLGFAVFSYNISVQKRLQASPFQLVYGRKPRSGVEEIESMVDFNLVEPDLDAWEKRHKRHQEIEKRITESREHNKTEYERSVSKLREPNDLIVGDYVFLRKRTPVAKLEEKVIGPYIVKAILRYGVYECQSLETGQLIEAQREQLINFNLASSSEVMSSLGECKTDFNEGGMLEETR